MGKKLLSCLTVNSISMMCLRRPVTQGSSGRHASFCRGATGFAYWQCDSKKKKKKDFAISAGASVIFRARLSVSRAVVEQ